MPTKSIAVFLYILFFVFQFSTPAEELFFPKRTLADVAYEIATEKVDQKEWSAFKTQTKDQYETWTKDNPAIGNMKIFLDTKLLEVIPSIRGKNNVNKVKKIFLWLALYVEFEEPVPSYLAKAPASVIHSFDALVDDKFTWERLADFSRELSNQHSDEIKE